MSLVEYRVTQIKVNHMFSIVHGSAPEYLKNSVNITREPAHNTRSSSFAGYILNVKSFGIKSFFFLGRKLWNSLTYSIQCITDKFKFKEMIKGTLWNRLRSVHIYNIYIVNIYLLVSTVFIRLLVSIYKIRIVLAVNWQVMYAIFLFGQFFK